MTNAKQPPRLFYLLEHAYAFERNDNWALLDEICEKLAGHEDIWYATNIEICEYVHAYYSLIHGADASKIYMQPFGWYQMVCLIPFSPVKRYVSNRGKHKDNYSLHFEGVLINVK